MRWLATFTLLGALALGAGAETVTDKAVDIATREWKFFGQQTIGKNGKLSRMGHREADEGYWQRVGTYWKEGVGLDLTGKDTDEPWSAAFISYVMKEAGAGYRFRLSEWHAHYIREAIHARQAGDTSYGYWGYRLSERAPQVGDLVGYARQDGIDFDVQPETYKSHTDLVVAVRPGEIDVIGGNVADSVTLKTLATDKEGKLVDKHQKWFVVLAHRF